MHLSTRQLDAFVEVARSLNFTKAAARLNITQAFQIFSEAIDIGQRQMTEMRLRLDKPEVVITPSVSDIGLLDTINVPEIARRGEIAALEALPDLRRTFSWQARLKRSLQRR